ncbi:hypothetical protein HF995_02390 [Sanguibacter hominis ATCC BAA-789]|uniref:Lipoprotein n=1 Tax=Sanguibacter hominis ATCC BAA-789 TaxID=1312740 RepID=A0A9X5F995_9MICO|nr:hypothetical protein [Sanguibacter hominis]NKX92130.1 hypothetical protein [Sanguibacter hominis ATCC BAA-789]
MTTPRSAQRARGALCLLAAALLVAGCTGDDAPEPTASGSVSTPTPGATATELEGPTVADVEAMAGEQVGETEPMKVVEGEIPDTGDGTFDAQAGVVAVEAGESSTRLVVTLRTTSGAEETVPLDAFNEWSPLTMDVRDLSVTDPAAQTVLLPYLGLAEGKTPPDGTFCLCSASPKTLDGDWVTVYATLPPLDPATTTVSVDVPGFPTVTEVPVTRS